MFDYLQKFNSLPKDLRDKVSSPVAMEALAGLENKYRVDLAMIVMKIMIKSLNLQNLPVTLVGEFGLGAEQAQSLAQEMKEKIFAPVADYLELGASTRAWDLEKAAAEMLKETGIALPSENLVSRFRAIISTYLKGVRTKIDTRAALAKGAKVGGLDLSEAEIDRVLKACEEERYRSLAHTVPAKVAPPVRRLDKIVAAAEVSGSAVKTAEYDLKQAIKEREVKKPAIDYRNEIAAPAKELDLPSPAKAQEKPAIFSPQKPAVKPTPPLVPPRPTPSAPKPAPVVPPKPLVAANRPAPTPSARPQMHDVRPMPKVMGPVEELQFLDVINFRRLGKTPEERTAKILAKIKLLEEDGYDKMILGVKAWRQSIVNRLYLALVKEAVIKGLPLEQELKARLQENPESLGPEEVQAIIALNSKLVF